jgi:hypothetical protein
MECLERPSFHRQERRRCIECIAGAFAEDRFGARHFVLRPQVILNRSLHGAIAHDEARILRGALFGQDLVE